MNKTTGYHSIEPRIKSVRFLKDKFELHLVDGRILIIPSYGFPEIEKLSPAQKRNYKTLAGIGLMFDDLDTVFHISDFIGNYFASQIPKAALKQKQKGVEKKTLHASVAEPAAKYRSNKKG